MSMQNQPDLNETLEPFARTRGLRRVSGGAVMSEVHGPAFTHVTPAPMSLPVLIAVPHAGRVYPADVLAEMRDTNLSQLRLEDRRVDELGVAIAKATGTGLMVAHAPRAVLDLNRSEDDIDWDMVSGPVRRASKPRPVLTNSNHRARSGLGLVPRRLPGFGEIWRSLLPREELDRRIDQIHRPYHAHLSGELQRIRDAWGTALLIDLHSMPPLRPKQGQEYPPKIVLGDRFGATCHTDLISSAFRYLDRNHWVAAHNRPYSGGYVLDRHAAPQKGIHAVQIEICRSAYLDDEFSETSDAIGPLAEMLAGLVRQLGAKTARLGTDGQMPQAAE